ncbi:hypothetical protein NPIL_500211 [Nephila pilipes]|uniref:Uncharacterized protein n=1 Tax=Nephila pilipes TaxID=299642 RepID=A0A8X6U0K5_NEPPI|nr:hypothetical protein NPIL_500211 [Nephila pilipes]
MIYTTTKPQSSEGRKKGIKRIKQNIAPRTSPGIQPTKNYSADSSIFLAVLKGKQNKKTHPPSHYIPRLKDQTHQHEKKCSTRIPKKRQGRGDDKEMPKNFFSPPPSLSTRARYFRPIL